MTEDKLDIEKSDGEAQNEVQKDEHMVQKEGHTLQKDGNANNEFIMGHIHDYLEERFKDIEKHMKKSEIEKEKSNIYMKNVEIGKHEYNKYDDNRDDLKIVKDLVVGFLIIKSTTEDGTSYVNTIPLDTNWDGFNDDHDLDAGETVIGVIPAPVKSYKVLGFFPHREGDDDYYQCGKYQTLGYEYAGTYHPDWNELLEEKIENDDRVKSCIKDIRKNS